VYKVFWAKKKAKPQKKIHKRLKQSLAFFSFYLYIYYYYYSLDKEKTKEKLIYFLFIFLIF